MMLQIIDLENNELFTEISPEESASISGGKFLFNPAGIAGLITGISFILPLAIAAFLPSLISASMLEGENTTV